MTWRQLKESGTIVERNPKAVGREESRRTWEMGGGGRDGEGEMRKWKWRACFITIGS